MAPTWQEIRLFVKRNKVGQRKTDVRGDVTYFEICSLYVSTSAVLPAVRFCKGWRFIWCASIKAVAFTCMLL